MHKLSLFLLLLSGLVFGCASHDTPAHQPYLFVLGVAQDAGYPQAGCYRPHCLPGWQDKRRQRGATSIALIDSTLSKKILFEATPQLPSQLYALEQEAPDADYELSGLFITHAHIAHYAGLMFFGHEAMGADKIPVYLMPRMTQFITNNGPWSQLVDFQNITLMPLSHNTDVPIANFTITPMLVPHRDEFSETVAYRIAGPNKSAIFIPDINKWQSWEEELAEIVSSVDYALLDATFYSHGELPGRDMSKIPHPFVTETMDLLQNLSARQRNKIWFIHMNHTNPLLDPSSNAHQAVKKRGFNIAIEGLRLPL